MTMTKTYIVCILWVAVLLDMSDTGKVLTTLSSVTHTHTMFFLSAFIIKTTLVIVSREKNGEGVKRGKLRFCDVTCSNCSVVQLSGMMNYLGLDSYSFELYQEVTLQCRNEQLLKGVENCF